MDQPVFIDHELLTRIEGFLSQNPKISETAFGRDVIGDGNLLPDLRAGRELRRMTRERVLQYLQHESPGEQA